MNRIFLSTVIFFSSAFIFAQENKTLSLRQSVQIAVEETALKFREGLATMTGLLQDEMSLSSAQANYLTALYNYREAEIKIMSLNGEIRNLYK